MDCRREFAFALDMRIMVVWAVGRPTPLSFGGCYDPRAISKTITLALAQA